MKSEPASDLSQPQNGKKFGKAIVLGASIAGLWTARALIDYFDEVVILERDRLPEGAEFRSGAPQVRQFHTLLYAGLQQMKAWFPGLEEELVAAGAVPYDMLGDVQARFRQRWFPRFTSGWTLLSCSRLLLESSIRRRLRQNPCIRFIEGVEVVGLKGDETKRRVIGARIRNRRSGSNQADSDPVYAGDLVVDALGRRSQTPEWLVQMGYSAPRESRVDSFLGYVTRRYKRKPNTPMLLIFPTPPNDPYGGLVYPEEDDTMIAMIGGYNKHYPPTDPEEFDAFVGKLGPEFAEALEGAAPISPPSGYRGTANNWRHYEQLEHWPERLVVLGDAFCDFNPIYGQGMTVAAMSAAALADSLRQSKGNLDGVAKSTLRKIGKITEDVWLLATSADLEWPGTEGGSIGNSPLDRFGRWYIGKVVEAREFDRKVQLEFLAVTQLIKPGSALFAPPVFLRVMRHALQKKRR